MNIPRLLWIGGSTVVAALVTSIVLVSYWRHSEPTSHGLPKLAAAVKAYAQDQRSRHQPVPAAVTVRQLITGGYISSNDVRAFDGMDVTIYPTALDRDPSSILIRVRLPDGEQIAALADGSIQSVPR
jgi:hypothetical protein